MEPLLKPPTMPPGFGGAPAAPATPPGLGGPGGAKPKAFSMADVKQYFHIVVKRIWLVALCFVISLTVMVVLLVRQVPVYSCRATLLLSQGLPIPHLLRQAESTPLGDFIDTQQMIINSGLLISRARERVNRPAAELGKVVNISVYPVGRTAFMAIQVDSKDPVVGAEMANALAEEYVDFKA